LVKRAVLCVGLSAALIGPATSSPATPQLTPYQLIAGSYASGSNQLQVFGFVTKDLLGNTQFAYAQISVATVTGTDTGTGVLDVTLDPTGSVGRLSGTITGQSGPITIDATYLATSLATNQYQQPNVYVYKTPGQLVLNGYYSWSRMGEFLTAAVTSGVGPLDAAGAQAGSFFSLSAAAP
jgi:hypothetical protein